ncbi:MAG: hypothetical protein WD490_03830, partial [Opitutales bacterium]
SFIVAGIFCGDIQRYFARCLRQAEARGNHYEERIQKLGMEASRLREVKDQLDRKIATSNADTATVDSEIRLLNTCAPEALSQNILLLLSRLARISDAALYEPGANNIWRRFEGIGDTSILPKELKAEEIEMVQLALERKTAVALPELRDAVPPPEKSFLIAAPFINIENRPFALLLVSGMPFLAFNQRNFNLLSNLCRWTATIMEARCFNGKFRVGSDGEVGRIYLESFFQKTVNISLQTYRDHELPSTVVLFYIVQASRDDQVRLEEALIPVIRSGDFPALIALPFPHLAVLLPLTGERGAGLFIQRSRDRLLREPDLADRVEEMTIQMNSVGSYEEILEHARNNATGSVTNVSK